MVRVESKLRNRVDDDVIGGILVSSREISERQEQTLHAATRELLGAETPQEVAAMASAAAVDTLDFDLNGSQFYDETVEGLAQTAVSDESRKLLDDVPVIDGG